jgi:hypothetical protein
MDRLTFGNCCSPTIAIYMTRRVADLAGQGKPEAVEAIHRKLYMDDYLDSASSREVAVQRAKGVTTF